MNVLKVYKDISQCTKGNKLQLFVLLPVKQSFTKSKISVGKTAIRDLILDDKGEILMQNSTKNSIFSYKSYSRMTPNQ